MAPGEGRASPDRDPYLPVAREEGAHRVAPLHPVVLPDCEFMDVPSVDALNDAIFAGPRPPSLQQQSPPATSKPTSHNPPTRNSPPQHAQHHAHAHAVAENPEFRYSRSDEDLELPACNS
jgi:hypothetical protein